MKYSELEQTEDLVRRFEVTLAFDETRDSINEIHAFLALQLGLDIVAEQPASALRERFGDDLEERVGNCLANQCADRIIRDLNLAAATEPTIESPPDIEKLEDSDVEKTTNSDEDHIVFTVSISLKPTVELSSYEPVEVLAREQRVTDEMVTAEMQKLAESRARYVPDQSIASADEGTYNIISVSTDKYGMRVDALTMDDTLHRVGDGLLPSQIDEELLGMAPGDSKQFSFSITSQNFLGLDVEETMECTLRLNSIVRKDVPDITDEWVRDNIAGAYDVESFTTLVRTSLTDRFHDDYVRVLKEAVAVELAKRLPDLDIPRDYYDYVKSGLVQNMAAALEQQGASEDQLLAAYGMTSSQIMTQMDKRASEIFKQGLAIETYARHEGISISDDDLSHALQAISADNEDQTRRMLEMNGRLYQLHETALRSKVRDMLVGQVLGST